MLFAIAAVVLVLWLLGFLAFHTAGAFIHILLIVALVVLVMGFLGGRKAA